MFKRFFSTTPYAALPYLGVFKPGALHPVTPAPIKAPTLRVVGDAEPYYGKRYNVRLGAVKDRTLLFCAGCTTFAVEVLIHDLV